MKFEVTDSGLGNEPSEEGKITMNTATIDTAMARRLVDALAIQGPSIIGRPGGWSVLLTLGTGQ